LAVALGGLVALGGTVGIVAASSSDPDAARTPHAGFSPKMLKGKWTGKWVNETFGSSGKIQANVKVRGTKMIPMVNFSGNVFGCTDPDAGKLTLKKGKGPNRWNGKGFKISKDTPNFGQLDLVYKHGKGTITGEGEKPPCSPDISYTVDGTLTKKRLKADVEIDLGGGAMASSTISARKK
jgi:hypothetical protein